jgi:hypothetical protein
MPKHKHLEILKRGVEAWNEWREGDPYLRPDLSGADLQGVETHGAYLAEADLRGLDFSGRDLSGSQLYKSDCSGAKFNGANLTKADLSESDCSGAEFNDANLTKADLRRSFFFRADLIKANLEGAELQAADFRQAYLMGANLRGIYMGGVDFTAAALTQADFTGSTLNGTIFGENYLDEVIGLHAVNHNGPSIIGVETIYLSQGKTPEAFLRGCGVRESLIARIPELVAGTRPAEFHSCFISYSSRDREFAERLYTGLKAKGVRVWFAPYDLPIGAKIRPAIDESISLHDRLLLVLSETSVSSQWVEQEVETALAKEREGRTVLVPIRIDDAVLESKTGWPALLKNTRNVGDFTRWQEADYYHKAFDRLVRDLRVESDNKLPNVTPNSLFERAILSPRNTIKEAWDEVESSIVQAAKRYGLVGDEKYVECAKLVNEMHKAGKISGEVREQFFNLSKVEFSVSFSSQLQVETGTAIAFVREAEELQKALAVDTPPFQ